MSAEGQVEYEKLTQVCRMAEFLVLPAQLRRVRGGFARHGGDTRPRLVLWRHATRAWRTTCTCCMSEFALGQKQFGFMLEQALHVHV